MVQKIYIADRAAQARPTPAICALHRIGLAYDNFADKLINAPMPAGIRRGVCSEALRDEFANQAQPLKDKAAEAFTAAVAKSHELDVYNDCSAQSLKMLRTTYRPEQFPEMPEEKVRARRARSRVAIWAATCSPPSRPSPPRAVEAAAKAAEQARSCARTSTTSTKQLRAQSETPVACRAAPKSPDARTPRTPKKARRTHEEPEDFL